MTEENKAVVRRLVHEVINKGRLEVADELFTPEGVAGAREAFTNFRSAFPDWREDIVDLIAEGDKVVGHFTCTGTLQGEFMGMPPTGKRMEIDEVYILRIEGRWNRGVLGHRGQPHPAYSTRTDAGVGRALG